MPRPVSATADNILVAHQPHFLPWPGYFNKIATADVFVALDDVQFRRRYFQNRTLVRCSDGRAAWLTMPVHAERTTLLRDVRLAQFDWRSKLFDRVANVYSNEKGLAAVLDIIDCVQTKRHKFLVDLNLDYLRRFSVLLGVSACWQRASDFSLPVRPDSRLVELCRTFKATHYLFGEGGGLAYHGTEVFHRAGLVCLQQQYRSHALEGVPPEAGPVNASIMHFVALLGPDKAADLVRAGELRVLGVLNG